MENKYIRRLAVIFLIVPVYLYIFTIVPIVLILASKDLTGVRNDFDRVLDCTNKTFIDTWLKE